jgi:16S rRNA (adenine1518-N6/adenine1519-N6)-dimethyltransferase
VSGAGAGRPRAGRAGGEHRARRRFSQNFLRDPQVIERIVGSLALRGDESLVEIGPGRGALTDHLIGTAGEFSVIEIDWDLVRLLSERYPDLSIHATDALRLDYDQLFPERPRFRVVGNLPYNISTPLLFHLLHYAGRIEDMTFMLQEEVVDRICAQPGTKAWGRLSVMVQYHCRVERLFAIPPSAFTPRPQVRSRLLRLTPFRRPPHVARSEKALRRVVQVAFGQRRKTLRNALKSLPDGLEERVALDWQQRPERLDVETFVRLADALVDVQEAGGGAP